MGLFDSQKPSQYAFAGHLLLCQVCGNDLFVHRTAKLNTSLMLVFNLGWADDSASCYICDKCGQILWFADEPDKGGEVGGE